MLLATRCVFITTLIVQPFFAVSAWATDENADLQAQMAALRQRVEDQDRRLAVQEAELSTLRADANEGWLNERRAEEVKSLIHEVLADAETRTSMIDTVFLGGHQGSNFMLRSEDGGYLLKIAGMVQFRYMLSTSDDAATGTPPANPLTDLDDTRAGFEMRRARIIAKGHIIDPSWQYLVLLQVNRGTGDLELLDSWVKKQLDENWSIIAGQRKIPVWREWQTVAAVQSFVERSLLTAQFAGSYTQGIEVHYVTDPVRAMVSLGDGASNTNAAWETEDVEGFSLAGRVEFMLAGDWKHYQQCWQAWPDDGDLAVIGAGFLWQQGEFGTTYTPPPPPGSLASGDEPQRLTWSVDYATEMFGVSLYAAVIGNHLTEMDTVGDLNQYGVLLQAGFFVNDDWEVVGRYEWGDLDVPTVDDLSILTIGATRYFKRHELKITTDVGYSFGALNTFTDANGNRFGWASDATGWRSDAPGSDGQIVFRTKLQLMF